MGQHQHLYSTAAWQRLRADQLAAEPLCAFCLLLDRITPATVADHVKPHRGDPDAFFTGKLQSLCKHCHDSTKQAEECNGYNDLVGEDGWPVDPRHPTNQTSSSPRTGEGGVTFGAGRLGIGVGGHARITASFETKRSK